MASSVLPVPVEEAIAAFMRDGKTGCWELHVHAGEIKAVKVVTSVPIKGA